MSEETQARVIAFLSHPETYNLSIERIQCITTHGAIVFLAGSHAYKMKRAVRFPYMDFSTIQKREAACRHELERNLLAAPTIYQDVIPVIQNAHGELELNGMGAPVEWLVVMKRFEQSQLLDNLASNDQLDLSMITTLADRIATYHQKAPKRLSQNTLTRLGQVITETTDTFRLASEFLSSEEVDAFSKNSRLHLVENSGLLCSRACNGLVRLCHGDLHLRNVVLINGQPTLFDAIEFDDNIATIDVLYDLAFLLMDLWHRDLRDHANTCFNRYCSVAVESAELNGLAALPLFLAMRAAIRAMVAVDLTRTTDPADRGEASKTEHVIRSYFDLATKFLQPLQTNLIAIGGRSGTGKSTLAAAIAPDIGRPPGALHLRSDVERKRLFGIDPLKRLPENKYTDSVTDQVYTELHARAEQALATGHSVILDATFFSPVHRELVQNIAKTFNARFCGIWLEAPEQELHDRVRNRRNDASDADGSVVQLQGTVDVGPNTWRHINASGNLSSVLPRVIQAARDL